MRRWQITLLQGGLTLKLRIKRKWYSCFITRNMKPDSDGRLAPARERWFGWMVQAGTTENARWFQVSGVLTRDVRFDVVTF